jgi:predicted acyltransferase
MSQAEFVTGRFSTDTLPQPVDVKEQAQSEPVVKRRLAALDAFRGLTILFMLLVNNISLDTQTPHQLEHAKWNLGLSLADMVFPWFLFCVGVALPYSYASFQKVGRTQGLYVAKAAVRGGTLVFLGCVLDSAINHHIAFSLGVLQLIGLAYFVAAVAYLAGPWYRVAFGAILLAGYGYAIQHLSFGSHAAGTFEETHNLLRHINNGYLAPYRLQGLLSTIPTAGLVLFGTLIGDILREKGVKDELKLASMLVCGIGLVAVGDVWSVFLPYNKPVWTPTYILVAGGLATIILALLFLIVDVWKQKWLAAPLVVLGSNAIVAYVVPILIKVLFLEIWMVQTPAGNRPLSKAILEWLKGNYGNVNGGWAYTIAYIAVWWLLLWALYRKRWFLKV